MAPKYCEFCECPHEPLTIESPVGQCLFGVRLHNAIESLNAKTIGDLCKIAPEELRRVRNMGKITQDELRRFLSAHGFSPKTSSRAMRIRMLQAETKKAIESLERINKDLQRLEDDLSMINLGVAEVQPTTVPKQEHKHIAESEPRTVSKLIPVKDVADMLGVSRRTVEAGIPGLRRVKIGHRVLWNPEDVIQFIQANTDTPTKKSTK